MMNRDHAHGSAGRRKLCRGKKKKKDNSGFWKQAYVSNCMGTGLRIVYDKFCQKYA